MKKLLGFPHASWFYSLTIILVVFSLLFSPLAGLGSRALAGGNESAAVQTGVGSEGQGNITNPEPATSPILQPEPAPENLTEITQIIPNVPPVISGVKVTTIMTTWATVVWTTDKPADTVVNYGTGTGLGLTVSDAGLTTDHSILVTGLEPGMIYYFEVQSTDYSLNTVTDNNGGVYYSFTTPSSDSTQLDAQLLEPQPSESQKIESPKTTALVSPDKDVELKSPSEKITLDIPAGAASENLRVDFIEQTPWGSTGMRIVKQFELNAYAVDRADAVVSKFDKELQITIKHSAEDLAGLDVDSLRLYYLDEKAQQWIPVESSKYDRETMTLTATVDHFSIYGEQANPAIMGPGRILSSQVNLNSGTASYVYPIEIPASSRGFQPTFNLVYNSGIADEMKNKRSVGSWVGIGWTLDLGHIDYDEGSNRYFLTLNGESYELVKISDNEYRTNPDSFYKVTVSGYAWNPYWQIYDREGRRYSFGDGLYYDNSHYYRWQLGGISDVDTSSIEQIQYNASDMTSYMVDAATYWTVRACYPQYVRYDDNHVEIKFNSSYDIDDPTWGHLRADNPMGKAGDPTKVVDCRRLDSIEVRVDGTLVRKYLFTYNTTEDYDGANYYYQSPYYVSGKHTLTSIREVDASGNSSTPGNTTFTYTDLPTRAHDTLYGHGEYGGNPGNPATFNWPHLTGVSNGYGATVTFAYTESPSSTADNIWTREVVTTKTINPGLGASQTYTYSYTGDPQYCLEEPTYADCWHSEYRGFSEVRATDASGAYTKHYFWTTGTMQAEYLTGREYKTEWYDSSNNLLKKQEYTWDYRYSADQYVSMPWNSKGYSPSRLDIGPDSYTYALNGNTVNVLNELHKIIRSWGSTGYGDGQFSNPSGIAVGSDGSVYVADMSRIQKFDSYGNFTLKWTFSNGVSTDVAVDSSGYVYVGIYDGQYVQNTRVAKYTSSGSFVQTIGAIQFPKAVDTEGNSYVYILDSGGFGQNNYYVKKYTTTGSYISVHGGFGDGDGYFSWANDIAVDSQNNHWVVQKSYYGRVQKFAGNGTFLAKFNAGGTDMDVLSVAVYSSGELAISRYDYQGVKSGLLMYAHPYQVYLSAIKETTYTIPSGATKVSQIRYIYDNYGNVITEYRDGDLDTTNDDATVQRVFYPNTSANILNKPARERVYATITDDVGGANLKSETRYYYDMANSDGQWGTAPTKGDLTRLQQYKDASTWVNTYYTYDGWRNTLTETDPRNNTTTYTYSSPYFALPTGKQYPTVGSLTMTESYTWDYGSGKITSDTDVNGVATTYEYDTFKRLIKVVKCGDSSASPTIQYQYNNWGTINQQQLKTIQKISSSSSIWKSEYFDGVGRVVQTQAQGETGYTIIDSTTTYNNRGLVDREYVSQNLSSGSVNGYYTPAGDWKYTSYAYDALGRVTTQTNVDATTISHNFSTPWKDLETNQRGYKKAYYNDAFDRLVKVEEYNASQALYSTTTYGYDVLNNLKQVVDNSSNTITMNYDWLSRKTSMTDPDMGSWSYGYDNNSNLTTQTDAKSQTITFTYDALSRLTGKTYPGAVQVNYDYDSTTGGNYGKGRRTSLIESSNNTYYKYDSRGRLIEEKRTIQSVNYTTSFGYDSADRQTTVTYPTGETVTQTYNGRGFPYTLSGSVAGNIVTSTLYNKLGQYTEINLNNGVKTTFGYYGVGGSYDTTGGYYGKLWEIKNKKATYVRQDIKYTWDVGGNVASRQDVQFGGTETFTYDFLDRLTAVSGAYTQSFSYNEIGNILTMNGSSYTYGTKPHAVTQVGSTAYSYDNNGNMISRGGTTITWDVENRPTAVGTATFTYDGNGNRLRKVEGGQTTLYINQYYEKNTTSGVVTTYYYLGDKLVALRNGTNLRYIHQDSLGSTSVVTNSSGAQYGYTRYYPYGSTRDSSGSLDTDKKFTGQRLDGTGLYYYGARYYDPTIGKFISPDSIIPNPANPQAFNRYSYVLNNPLKYTDPTGHGWWSIITDIASIVFDVYQLVKHPSWGNAGWLTLDVGLTLLPVVPAGAGPAARALGKGDKIIEGADKIVEGVKAGKTGAHVAEESTKIGEFLTKAGRDAKQTEQITKAFNPGTKVVKLEEDTVVYRYWGGSESVEKGNWVTDQLLSDPKNQLSLPLGNTAEHVTSYTIPKGTEVVVGTAAPNFGRTGGGTQIYITDKNILK